MGDVKILQEEFGPAQRAAYALAGTVALPAPIPASGQLFLGMSPPESAPLIPGITSFYLRLVHVVSAKQVTTRFLAIDDLRGVSLPGASPNAPRQQKARADIESDIRSAQKKLEEAAENGIYEVPLYPDVVIHMSETAPVLMRITYEFGVTAAESVSRVSMFTVEDGPCFTKGS